MLGERLFPLIQRMYPDLAGKITGMLLEIDNAELLHMLEDHSSLKSKVKSLDLAALNHLTFSFLFRSTKPWLSSRLTREKPLTRSKNRKREFLSEPKLSITIPSRVIIAFYYFLAELTGKLLIRMSSVSIISLTKLGFLILESIQCAKNTN